MKPMKDELRRAFPRPDDRFCACVQDTLRDLNGLFRACLTHDGTRCAGWIFSKRREQEVRSALAAYLK